MFKEKPMRKKQESQVECECCGKLISQKSIICYHTYDGDIMACPKCVTELIAKRSEKGF